MIIKLPFRKMTMADPNALDACLNDGEAYCPRQMEAQAICLNGDTGESFRRIKDRTAQGIAAGEKGYESITVLFRPPSFFSFKRQKT